MRRSRRRSRIRSRRRKERLARAHTHTYVADLLHRDEDYPNMTQDETQIVTQDVTQILLFYLVHSSKRR